MRKDFFNRDLREGDFVVCCRRNGLHYGYLKANGNVRTRYSTVVDPELLLLDMTNPEIKRKAQELLDHFDELDEAKKLRTQAKLKRSEFRVGHVYHKVGQFHARMYLGRVDVVNHKYKNLWVTLRRKNHRDDWTIENLDFNQHVLVAKPRGPVIMANTWSLDDIKCPMVHEEIGVVPTVDLIAMTPAGRVKMHQNVGDAPL